MMFRSLQMPSWYMEGYASKTKPCLKSFDMVSRRPGNVKQEVLSVIVSAENKVLTQANNLSL